MSRISVGLPGEDVKNSPLNKQVLNSLYPSPKINAQTYPPHAGLITMNWGDTTESPLRGSVRNLHSFPHGYNSVPTVLGNYIVDLGAGGVFAAMLPLVLNLGADSIVLFALDADLVNVNLKVLGLFPTTTTLGAFSMKIRFYVFAERGKD